MRDGPRRRLTYRPFRSSTAVLFESISLSRVDWIAEAAREIIRSPSVLQRFSSRVLQRVNESEDRRREAEKRVCAKDGGSDVFFRSSGAF